MDECSTCFVLYLRLNARVIILNYKQLVTEASQEEIITNHSSMFTRCTTLTGTDLEQYLPKNFGLPENSPFLEKSPPNTAKAAIKPKTHSVRSAITKVDLF